MPDSTLIDFGGIQGVRGLVMPFPRGCSPGVGTLFLIPRDGLDVPPSTLSFGSGGSIVSLPGCVLGNCFIRNVNSRPVMACQILDRRWRWQFTSVSGNYNARLASGLVDPNTAKTPGELASLILSQMGETGFDVSRMPTGVYPPANWNANRGDLALAELCDYVACEVVLNPLTNRVEIWPLGVGTSLPTGLTESTIKYRYIPRSGIPSTVEVHCGESLYQYRLKLESISRSSNLTQTRTPDWMQGLNIATQSWNFPGVSTTLGSSLALATGHRQYRVVGQEGGNLNVPGLSVPITNTRQYVLRDHLIFSVLDDRTQRYQKLPYYIEGDFWPYSDLASNVSNQVYVGPSTLYADRNLVEFPFPVVKIGASGAIEEPTLYLQTAYGVQDSAGNRWRYVYQTNVGGSGGKLIIRRPEIFAAYSASANTEAQAAAESSLYAGIFQRKFQNSAASELTYRGILNGFLDGNIAQATWSMIPGRIPTTKVSEVFEADVYSTGAIDRRRREQLARLVEA